MTTDVSSFPPLTHDHRPCVQAALDAAEAQCQNHGARFTPLRRRVLERAGYRVFWALSGREGIERFRYQPTDVAIVDYWMAGMNGLEVAKAIKAMSSKTPIIMLSGFTTILDEGLGKVDLWLRKGDSNPEQLLMAVVHMLDKRREKG